MHVFNTWLIANLLHPLIAVVCALLVGDLNWNDKVINILFQLLAYSIVFSLPALFVAACIMWLIIRSSLDAFVKFIAWLFLCTSLPAIFFIIFTACTFNDWILIEELLLILPATIAVFVTIIVRFKSFLIHINTAKETTQH